MRTKRIITLGLALGALALAAGCGPDSATPAKVSGVVKYQNQPLKGGKIVFHDAESRSYSGEILEDGSYSIVDLPVGELKVTVDTEPLKDKAKTYGGDRAKGMGMSQYKPPGSPDKPPEDARASRYVKIPAKYASVATTDLKATLTKGKNQKDIELTD